ncbi:MAG: histidinol-phosphatase [Aestuariivirga sp.]
MPQETARLLEFARELAVASAGVILPQFRKNIAIEVKQAKDWDPVTEGDRAAERIIRHVIEGQFPTHGIIGEEFGTKSGSSAYTWVLDPIDGTRSFVIGMPTWATLIGLYRDGQPLLGVMNQPYVGDMFYGSPEGAWLDHRGSIQSIKCRAPVPLKHAAAGTTSPHLYDPKSNFETMRKSVQLMRYGGDAYFFSLVAAGHLDLAMDAGLQIYDIAALIPIITGAGGVVGTWDGKDPAQGGNIIAASNRALLDEAFTLMQS